MINLNKRTIRVINSMKIYLLISLLLIGTVSCQLTENKPAPSQYGHYYLWLKNLSNDEIISEIKQQQQYINNGNINAEINLAMLYSLANSPVFNPYTAKTKLNKFSPPPKQAGNISAADFGFLMMMKDQLNQQILAINKLAVNKKKHQQQTIKLNINTAEYKKLLAQFVKLNEQMLQLKKIELNINNQEQ